MQDRKNYQINILKMRFTLLNKKSEFIISTPTKYTIEDIGENIMYITLNISTYKARNLYININKRYIS